MAEITEMHKKLYIGHSKCYIFTIIIILLWISTQVSAQLAWSPILVDSESESNIAILKRTSLNPNSNFSGQIDLWTRKATGCSCIGQQNYARHKLSNATSNSKEVEEIRHNHTRRHQTQGCACCVTGNFTLFHM